jgi:glycosyltransferase involved in cell wall biosynthesis
MTARRSAIALATTEDTAKRIRKMGAPLVQISSALFFLQEQLEDFSKIPPPSSDRIRFISIVRLIHWKGLHLSLRAFAKANLPQAEYWILGEGSEQSKLQSLAIELGIGEQVKFLGQLNSPQVIDKLAQSSVLIHPSLHDSGGWVCLEAMAAKRPVICIDIGGPAQQVTEATGIKVSAINPEQAINDLSQAMQKLTQDIALINQMGEAGRQRIREAFSWESKGQQLSDLYQKLANQHQEN